MIAWQIRRSSTVGSPSSRTPPLGLGICTRRTGCGLRAGVELAADLGPVGVDVRPELGRGHAVGTRCPAVALDHAQGPSDVGWGEHVVPQTISWDRVRGVLIARRRRTALSVRVRTASPSRHSWRPTGWVRCDPGPPPEPRVILLCWCSALPAFVLSPPVLRPLLTPVGSTASLPPPRPGQHPTGARHHDRPPE
jgi:hypothetical protein